MRARRKSLQCRLDRRPGRPDQGRGSTKRLDVGTLDIVPIDNSIPIPLGPGAHVEHTLVRTGTWWPLRPRNEALAGCFRRRDRVGGRRSESAGLECLAG